MYKLSEETKKHLSETIGIPYEKLITMDDDEITAYIEQKNCKKMGYSNPNPMFSGSGDDSVLIDAGRYRTMEDVDKEIDKLTHKRIDEQTSKPRLLDKIKGYLTKQDKTRRNTMVYGVYKEVLYEGEISAMDYLMLNPFKRKEYVFPCLFLSENDAMSLRNAYTRIQADGEKYIVYAETYNNIFGNGQSPFRVSGQKLYHSYDEFVAERKSEYKNNPRNNNVSGNVRLSNGQYRTFEEQEKYIEDSLERELP